MKSKMTSSLFLDRIVTIAAHLNTGVFIKSVTTDVMKEEKDTIEASGLPLTEVMQRVVGVAKQWYMQQL